MQFFLLALSFDASFDSFGSESIVSLDVHVCLQPSDILARLPSHLGTALKAAATPGNLQVTFKLISNITTQMQASTQLTQGSSLSRAKRQLVLSGERLTWSAALGVTATYSVDHTVLRRTESWTVQPASRVPLRICTAL